MKFAPGSVGWLVAFDIRLAFDRLGQTLSLGRSQVSVRRIAVNFLILFAFLHLVGWLVVVMMRAAHIDLLHQLLALSIVIASIWVLTLGGVMYATTTLLFIRGDLDLLCSSPVPVRNIFTARALSIALQAIAVPAVLCLPVADMAALYGDLRWLAAYPMSVSLGLITAASGLLLTLLLVRNIGPRHARNLGLILSALFGAVVFLAAETPAMLGQQRAHELYAAVGTWMKTAPLARANSWLWYPARALQGDITALVVVFLIGLMCFALAVWLLPQGFLFAVQSADGSHESSGRRAIRTRVRFHSRFGSVVFLKEWRLVLRDPWLLTQLGRRVIFLVPAAVILLRDQHQFSRSALMGTGVCAFTFIAGILASALIWLAVCAEDTPDLLASAPRNRNEVRMTKLFAMLVPIWVLTLMLAIWMTWFSLLAAIWLIICVTGVTLSVGVFHLMLPVSGSRRDLNRRLRMREGMTVGRQIISTLILAGWGVAAFCVPAGHWILGLFGLAVGSAGAFIAWQRGRNATLVLGY